MAHRKFYRILIFAILLSFSLWSISPYVMVWILRRWAIDPDINNLAAFGEMFGSLDSLVSLFVLVSVTFALVFQWQELKEARDSAHKQTANAHRSAELDAVNNMISLAQEIILDLEKKYPEFKSGQSLTPWEEFFSRDDAVTPVDKKAYDVALNRLEFCEKRRLEILNEISDTYKKMTDREQIIRNRKYGLKLGEPAPIISFGPESGSPQNSDNSSE